MSALSSATPSRAPFVVRIVATKGAERHAYEIRRDDGWITSGPVWPDARTVVNLLELGYRLELDAAMGVRS